MSIWKRYTLERTLLDALTELDAEPVQTASVIQLKQLLIRHLAEIDRVKYLPREDSLINQFHCDHFS